VIGFDVRAAARAAEHARVGASRRTLLMGFGALALSGCFLPVSRLRYRLTLYFKVNGAAREFWTDIELRYTDNTNAPLPIHDHLRCIGQAIIADFDEPVGPIVGLLGRIPIDYSAYVWPERLFLPDEKSRFSFRSPAEKVEFLKERLKTETRLPDDLAPSFVRFADLTDWLSVEEVTAESLVFISDGAIEFVAATVVYTDRPSSKGIEARLPWLKRREVSFRSLANQRLREGLSRGHFQLR